MGLVRRSSLGRVASWCRDNFCRIVHCLLGKMSGPTAPNRFTAWVDFSWRESPHNYVRKALAAGFFMQAAKKRSGIKDTLLSKITKMCWSTHPQCWRWSSNGWYTNEFVLTPRIIFVQWPLWIPNGLWNLHPSISTWSTLPMETSLSLERVVDKVKSDASRKRSGCKFYQ